MAALDQLQIRATKAARYRGHTLDRWNTYHGESRSLSNNECIRCGAWVQCNTKPLPNEIDIGGTAVAIGCEA
jgi:hypothetical protein